MVKSPYYKLFHDINVYVTTMNVKYILDFKLSHGCILFNDDCVFFISVNAFWDSKNTLIFKFKFEQDNLYKRFRMMLIILI